MVKNKSIMEISIGNLIDQLSICNQRIWAAEDIKRKAEGRPILVYQSRRVQNNAEQRLIAPSREAFNRLGVQRLHDLAGFAEISACEAARVRHENLPQGKDCPFHTRWHRAADSADRTGAHSPPRDTG